jgi:apolipoprotein N-acyltransferase
MWDRLLRNAKPRARILRSIVFAAAWFTPSMLWMVDLTAPGYLIAIVVFSLYVGVAGLAVPGRSSSAWVRWLALPAAFTLAEAARCTFPFGGVPLATTAMGQASAPLGQIARVLCAVGVTFAVAVIGAALSAAWERRHVVAAAALAGVIALWLAAIVAPSGSDIRTINAAVVQGGGPQGTRATETDPRDVFDRHIEASSLITTPVDLVVWPENVVAVDAPIASARENAELSALAKDLNTTLVAGVTEDLDSSSFANASIVYLPDGSTGERYDKVRRVPFGEYVPLRWLIESVAGTNTGIPVREARAGTEPAIVRTPAPPTVRATGSLRCKHSKLLQANSAQSKLVDGFCKPLQPVSPQSSILQETFWSERRFRSKRYCNKTSCFDRATRSRPSLAQCPSFGSRRSFSHSLGGSRRIISRP